MPKGDAANLQVLRVRDGSLSDRRGFFLQNVAGESETEIIEQFTIHYYSTPIGLPAEVVLPESFTRQDGLREFLSVLKGSRVEVRSAVRASGASWLKWPCGTRGWPFEQDRLREEEFKSRPAKAMADLKKNWLCDAFRGASSVTTFPTSP